MIGGSVVLQDFLSPATSELEDPQSPPPASESGTTSVLRSIGSALAPCSLVSTVARHPTSSTGPPWSVVPLSTLQDSTPPHPFVPLAPSGSSLPLAPPLSSVAPALLRNSESPSPPQSPELPALPKPSGSSVSPWLCGCLSPTWAPTPLASSLSVGPLVSPARIPLSWLDCGSPLGSSCSGLLPGSFLHLLHPGPMNCAPFPLPDPHPPPEPPPSLLCWTMCRSGRGRSVTVIVCFCSVSVSTFP